MNNPTELKSYFCGYAPLIDGGKGEMWLESGWDNEKHSFILNFKIVNPATGEPIKLEKPTDESEVERMKIGRGSGIRNISEEIQKFTKEKKE